MRSTISHNSNSFLNNSIKAKGTKNILDFIVRTIEKNEGLTLSELKRTKTQKELYRIGLFHFTTTNKTICEALKIPVEAGTRRKRDLENEGRLFASIKKDLCPFTKHRASFLTTNPKHISKLLK